IGRVGIDVAQGDRPGDGTQAVQRAAEGVDDAAQQTGAAGDFGPVVGGDDLGFGAESVQAGQGRQYGRAVAQAHDLSLDHGAAGGVADLDLLADAGVQSRGAHGGAEGLNDPPAPVQGAGAAQGVVQAQFDGVVAH